MQPAGRGDPSNWQRRLAVAGMAFVGWTISSYLALFQLHLIGGVWDPIFGGGSRAVLRSSFSRSLPVPDALLGALSYVAEITLDLTGPTDRWRSKPRLVLTYGAAVTTMAAVSFLLVALQIFAFGQLCALCLASAAVSWTVAVLAANEVAAAWGAWKMRAGVTEPVSPDRS